MLLLGGANTYSGGTIVNAGTVSISADENLGAIASGLTLDGGALKVNLAAATITNTHVINVGVGGGTIQVTTPTSGTPTYIVGAAGNLTGSGALTVTGTGILGVVTQ